MNYILAPETEVVVSRYDPQTRTCFYTVERHGKRWTVEIHIDHLHQAAYPHRTNPAMAKQARRDHLAKAVQRAMLDPPDAP